MKELKNWFNKRGYPEKIVSEKVNRALRSEESLKENDGQYMRGNGVPLVVTYNSNFRNLSFLICKNLQFLFADPKNKRVFTPALFVCFRSARNLKEFFSKILSLPAKEEGMFCKMQ